MQALGLVLLLLSDLASTLAFDRRLRAYLAEAAPDELGHTLRYSAGIAIRGSAEDTLQAMLLRADATLYSAKARSRSCTLDTEGVQLENAWRQQKNLSRRAAPLCGSMWILQLLQYGGDMNKCVRTSLTAATAGATRAARH